MNTPGTPSSPDWQPRDLGEKPALESLTSVAAPLLGGFSVTLAAVVLSDPDKLRWPGVAGLLAVVAAIALISSVQWAAWARQYTATPDDFRNWFLAAQGDLPSTYKEELARLEPVYRTHAQRAKHTYNVGIALLFAALGMAVAPPDEATQGAARWIAASLAFLACSLEVAWTMLLVPGRHLPVRLTRMRDWIMPKP